MSVIVIIFSIGILATAICVCGVLWHAFRKARTGYRSDIDRGIEAVFKTERGNWVVCGMMGSGKTHLSQKLSQQLGLDHIEIDNFSSKDGVVDYVDQLESSQGWIAEANPWQIPGEVFAKADAVIFLDFDNVVNYVRLFRRGFSRWKSDGSGLTAFHHHIWEKAIKDWCRIVFLHGKANRDGWRKKGISGLETDKVSFSCIRCISPAEVAILLNIIARNSRYSS